MTQDRVHGAEKPAEVVAKAVQEAVSPTAPGQPTEDAVVVDLPQVVPPSTAPVNGLLGLGAGCGVLFVALAVAVGAHAAPVGTVDGTVHLWVLTHRGPLDVDLANTLTWGGATVVALPALVVIGAVARRGPARFISRVGSGVLLAGIASLGAYLGLMINSLMGGQRPDAADWAGTASGPTFPSGHTTMGTIFAACCVWALAPWMRTRGQVIALWCAAAVYALVVGVTRVWLGVHWPSDVVGGWLFGVSWTALAASALIVARRRWPRPSLKGQVT